VGAVVTKATEIKIENDREDSADGFRDRRRSMKLVPARKSVGKGRSFNIGVAENMFSPRAAVVDGSGLRSSAGKKLAGETMRGGSDKQFSDTLRTLATVGIFVIACGLGFLIGRRRD
jgi:hypothetical protein